jgi:uncharacterized protein YbjQ (UPF0145 family)
LSQILLTTTPLLQDRTIIEYKGLVTVRVVRAVNIVRDFFTSFRDIFGGRSGSYEDVMKGMESDILQALQARAQEIGANAIVGLSIDFDNVGAKRKSLVMAYAKGTAVVVQPVVPQGVDQSLQ